MTAVALPDVAHVTERDGRTFLDYSQLHRGQRKAYWSTSRITLILAGTQGGKTAVGPPWLLKQIAERGPGDYIVAAPTFTLMEKKVLPEFLRLFRDTLQLGEWREQKRKFVLSRAAAVRLSGDDPGVVTQIHFGYGEDSDSLESMTAKAAWLDEPGQKKFKRESFEAIVRRLSIEQGPMLLTTTPYLLGWLSELVNAGDPDLQVINFPSIANPRFPLAEWERAQRMLPAWKFNMFYRGLFERPAGMIYDCWDDSENETVDFAIPTHWTRFLGLDFGGVNTAAVFLAEERTAAGERTGRYFEYREYHAGGRTAAQHREALMVGEPRIPRAFGGSKSEGQWRQEFAQAGLPIEEPPVSDVEVGITRVYGLIKERRLLTFKSLKGVLDQTKSYSRVLDDRGEPTEAIEDKDAFHLLDARRYVVAGITRGQPQIWV